MDQIQNTTQKLFMYTVHCTVQYTLSVQYTYLIKEEVREVSMLDVEPVQATWMLIVKNQNVHHDEKNLEPIQLGNEEVKASDLRIMNGRGRRGK